MKFICEKTEEQNNKRVSYNLNEMNENEYNTICKALELMQDDEKAAYMLEKLKEVAEEIQEDFFGV